MIFMIRRIIYFFKWVGESFLTLLEYGEEIDHSLSNVNIWRKYGTYSEVSAYPKMIRTNSRTNARTLMREF